VPEGDILGVVNGAARLIHADHCIGHGKCAAECPVDAIKLVFGTSERGVDLPMVDEFFESSRPGVHIIGELGGMGLIRNAVTQGIQAAERLAQTMPKSSGSSPDVVIVARARQGWRQRCACARLDARSACSNKGRWAERSRTIRARKW